MAGEGVAQAVTGASAVGRYFTVVSLLPSTVFVAYAVLLAKTGAWGHHDVALASAIGKLAPGDAAVIGIASVLLSLVAHPLGFALIQVYEGYWGTSRLATLLATGLTVRHRRRSRRLSVRGLRHYMTIGEDPNNWPVAKSDATRKQIHDTIAANESLRLHNSYPAHIHETMPTTLGNVLRRYERLAGLAYGLDAVATVPRVLQVADAKDVSYVYNQRTQLELALRTSFLSLLATVLTLAAMWRHGFLVILAAVPYALSFAAYRGAVSVAHEYGTSLAVLVELNRFSLYDRLRLPQPADIEDERLANGRLVDVLRLDNRNLDARMQDIPLDYIHPSPQPAPVQVNVASTSDDSNRDSPR
jgi:hypothetical protein